MPREPRGVRIDSRGMVGIGTKLAEWPYLLRHENNWELALVGAHGYVRLRMSDE